jgi:hypothetical protein
MLFSAEINPGFNQMGISGGNATAPTNGSFDVSEFYGEIVVPVLERLSLDATGLYSGVCVIGTGQKTQTHRSCSMKMIASVLWDLTRALMKSLPMFITTFPLATLATPTTFVWE